MVDLQIRKEEEEVDLAAGSEVVGQLHLEFYCGDHLSVGLGQTFVRVQQVASCIAKGLSVRCLFLFALMECVLS